MKFNLKNLIFSVATLFFVTSVGASTFRTEPIDGANTFVPDETFSGTSASIWYFTWDATNFYFAIKASDVSSGDANKWVHLYIDTDPNTPITGGTGSSTGVNYNTQTPTLPFSANYHFRWKADNTYTNMLDYNDVTGSWTDDNTNGGNLGIAAWQSGDFVEFSIPRASLGNPNAIHVSGSMITEQGGSESTFFMFPNNNTEGYETDYNHFYGFPLISLFSPNTAINLDNNLPVELTYFKARTVQKAIHLNWQTAQEINNDFFQIERKNKEQDWSAVGRVAGRGNSDELNNYDFVDEKPSLGTNYYRLKQMDFDGSFAYSETVKAEIQIDRMEVFPNPTAETFSIFVSESANSTLYIFDAQGRQVFMGQLNAQNQIDISHLAPGVYFLKLMSEQGLFIAEEKIRKL